MKIRHFAAAALLALVLPLAGCYHQGHDSYYAYYSAPPPCDAYHPCHDHPLPPCDRDHPDPCDHGR